ncbi:MAG: alcohol dehydrogenase catalytic domain-containing protein [candidate division NC10 bacterium]|nr:alcohol dehydrogenase catalytic domain-containing protein [candidate division NC10 bacterium]
MRAVTFHGPGDIRYGTIPVPRPGPGEVLVRVEVALTCATDVKTFRRGHPVMIQEIPTVFGHEFAGAVAALGKGVEGFALGQRVVAANSVPCFACEACRGGRENLCDRLLFLNGAFAEYVRIPAALAAVNLLPLPDDLPAREAAFLEPLACALHALDRAGVRAEDTVAILGTGPLGLLLLQAARLRGARCIAAGRGTLRLSRAYASGAEVVVDVGASPDPVAAIRERTAGGLGPDIVIEAVGRPEAWEQAAAIVRKGGTVLFFGGCAPGTEIRLDTRRLHYEELTLLGVFHHTTAHVRQALHLLAGRRLALESLISHEMSLKDLEAALTAMERREALKVAIIP